MSAPFRRTERAPVLLVFGPHAARVGDLVRLRPGLLNRIAYAPARAMHAMGAWLHLAPAAAQADQEVAATLDGTNPRNLLAAAIPDAPPGLYRALDRAGDRVREREFYERLASACRTPLREWLLEGDLDNARLDHAEALGRMDPVVSKVHAMLPQPYLAGNLNAVLAWLRSHDAIADEDLHLPPRSGLPALVRRLQLSLDTVPAPSPGFKLAAPYRQIATIGELRAIGATLGNCVASPRMFANDYWFRLVDGSTIYITRDEPPLLLAALRRVGPGLWQLDQVGGRKGDTVGRMEYDQLSEALRSAGVTVLKEDPGHAFANLWSHVKRRSDPHQDLEDLEVAGVEPEIDF